MKKNVSFQRLVESSRLVDSSTASIEASNLWLSFGISDDGEGDLGDPREGQHGYGSANADLVGTIQMKVHFQEMMMMMMMVMMMMMLLCFELPI